MRGWGPWNLYAIRVSNRILVLVDSMSPWDRPWRSHNPRPPGGVTNESGK